MLTSDDDYDSNTTFGPIKKNSKGVSYNGMNYYAGNYTVKVLDDTIKDKHHTLFLGKNHTFDAFSINYTELPNSVNKNGIKIVFTGKTIKHRLSCGCWCCKHNNMPYKKGVQKYNDKQFQSIINDAFYEGDSD